jgi:RNA polymerase sigma factor (sigma-70 family)
MSTNLRNGSMGSVVEHLRRIAGVPEERPPLDRDLLERFLGERDESAFTALVQRHGPMVAGVCRRILPSAHDVEDVFQATFLLLAHKARSIRKHDSLGCWLHGVAHRLALRVKARAARQRGVGNPSPGIEGRTDMAHADLTWRETRALLDEELQGLPDDCRAALVLCYLEDKTHDEAAHQLGWSKGTLRRRLGQGRELLRQRLVRRGLSLSVALVTTLLAEGTARSAVPTGLAHTTARTATLLAGGKALGTITSAAVADLVRGGLQGLVTGKLKIATAVLLAVGLLTAAGVLTRQTTDARETPAVETVVAEAPATEKAVTPKADNGGETVEATGRVVDPEGKPVTGAKVYFLRWVVSDRPHRGRGPARAADVVRAQSGADGKFHFAVARAGYLDGWEKKNWFNASVVAVRDGYGPAVATTSQERQLRNLTLRLVRDDVPIQGRVVDLEGKPIAGVRVHATQLIVPKDEDLGPWLARLRTEKVPHSRYPATYVDLSAADLPLAATTASDGRFRLSGVGRERLVFLQFEGPTIVRVHAYAMTHPGPTVVVRGSPDFNTPDLVYHGARFDQAVAPCKPVEGVVRDKDSGKPLAGVKVQSFIIAGTGRFVQDYLRATTDAEGRYRLLGLPKGGGSEVRAIPAEGQPYFMSVRPVGDSPGLDPVRVDFALKRGIPIHGRVTDKATGKPVRAMVSYFVFITNPNLRQVPGFRGSGGVEAATAADGSFSLIALPGRGILAVKAEGDNRERYVTGAGADQIKEADRAGHFITDPYICDMRRFNTLAEVNPEPGATSVTQDLTLDPGKTVTGTVVGPDGKPLSGCSITGSWGINFRVDRMETARFTIPALDPRRPAPFFFQYPEKHLAAAVVLKGDEPETLTIRLQPTATITGRLVDADGDPRPNVNITSYIEPGQFGIAEGWGGLFNGTTDKDGRFRIDNVIPGVRFSGWLQSAVMITGEIFAHQTFKPGEMRDFGDVKERPLGKSN